MGDDNRFFKFLWRFNALAIAGVAVLGILGLGLMSVGFLVNNTAQQISDVVNVGDQKEVKNDFILGIPSAVTSTDYVRTTLYRDQSYDRSYYSKSTGGNQVNYLFVDTRSGKNSWLLPTVNQLFLSSLDLSPTQSDYGSPRTEVVGIAYAVIDRDTNGDGVLSERDAIGIAHSAPDGTGYVKKIDGIDRLFSLGQITDDKVMVLYEKGGVTQTAIYDLPMQTVLNGVVEKVNVE